MKQESLKFRIDQIRKDKIIYAVEAGATNTICLFVYLFAMNQLEGQLQTILVWGSLIVGVGYTLYMGIGNFMRLSEVKKLEKELTN